VPQRQFGAKAPARASFSRAAPPAALDALAAYLHEVFEAQGPSFMQARPFRKSLRKRRKKG
jgi:hypothetical protein